MVSLTRREPKETAAPRRGALSARSFVRLADVEVEVLANLPLVRADALQPTVEVLLQAMRHIRNLGYRDKLVPLTSQGCSGRGSMHCYGQQLLDPGKTVSSNLCFMHYNDVQCSCHGTNRCIVRQPE